MGFFDTLLERFDRCIGSCGARWVAFGKKYFIYISVPIMTFVTGLFFFSLMYERPYYVAHIIEQDLDTLAFILNRVDQECEMLHLNNNHTVLDFLTVKSFAGSEVGGVNLAHPENWRGPYITQNPALQQCYYELIFAKDGLFIVPGKGATLPSGKTIGKDIIFDTKSFIGQALAKDGDLCWQGVPLARKLTFKIGDWHTRVKKAEKVSPIDTTSIEKFNEALDLS